jgi:hypothetical protein
MSAKRQRQPRQRQTQSFVGCLRKFLTPDLYKQAHQAAPHARSDQRWNVQPLLLALLFMTWAAGDSQPERFHTARAFLLVLTPKRRRPGKTVQGFQQALRRLPMPVLRVVAAGLRQRFLVLFDRVLDLDGFRPFGCDGTRLECPRTPELEQRLGQAGKKNSAPTVWVTAIVHLSTGLLWSWWIGKGTASERSHLLRLLGTLPARALLVADAGYVGYTLAAALMASQVSFLIRVSSQITLYTDAAVATPLARWQEGLVYYWPKAEQKAEQLPLLLRLVRVPARQRKHDVWLLTNVLESRRLPAAQAAQFYKMRWGNEGFFRTYKRTLKKVKLVSRSVALVHREVEGSLLAVQLLLAQGTLALGLLVRRGALSSPRQVLRELRRELEQRLGRRGLSYLERLLQAQRERRQRTSSKEKRVWPRRKPHKAPKPPPILTLDNEQKALIAKLLHASKAA